MEFNYEEYLKTGTERIKEYCDSQNSSKGEQDSIINAFSDALMNSIGAPEKLDDSELIICAASIRYIDQEMTKILAYKTRTTADRHLVKRYCERQKSLIDLFGERKWHLPEIRYSDPESVAALMTQEEKRIQEEHARIEREKREKAERDCLKKEKIERERREKAEREEQERKERNERILKEQQERRLREEEERQEELRRIKRKKRYKLYTILILIAAVGMVVFYFVVFVPLTKYNNAVQMIYNKQYTLATAAFKGMINYRDSTKRLKQIEASKLYDQGDLAGAYDIYEKLGSDYNQYKDNYESLYSEAGKLAGANHGQEAFDIYYSLGKYKDSPEKAKTIGIATAEEYEKNKEFESAQIIYTKLKMKEKAKKAAENSANETKYRQASQFMQDKNYKEAAALFRELNGYEDSILLANECDYLQAAGLVSSGEYEEAEALYLSLEDYKDSKELLSKVRYIRAEAYEKNEEYEKALEIYDVLKDENKATEMKYIIGSAYLQEGREVEAIEWLAQVGDYKDANNTVSVLRDTVTKRVRNKTAYEIGNTIVYGHYEQDGQLGNGKEPIEWIIIGKNKDNTAIFVTSKYALDCKQYNSKKVDTTWKHSPVRTWLNGTFLKTAFTEEEIEGIKTTAVSNQQKDGNPGYHTSAGENTKDKVYLLSYYEVMNYFKTDKERILSPTQYAISQGAHQPTCYWMTRSPGREQFDLAAVKNGGQNDHSTPVTDEHLGIRPAMWLDLENEAVINAAFSEGSVVTFGKYGDAVKKNYEPLRWKVVANDGEKALLLAENVIYCQQFHRERIKGITWENSNIRQWLNDGFITKAFSEDERRCLVLVNHKLNKSDNISGYRIDTPTEVEDKVYLLSYKQVLEFEPNKEDRRTEPTEYARSLGAGGTYTEYWLLSPGKDDYGMAVINQNGDYDSKWITDTNKGVRPLINIYLNFGVN